MKVELPKTETLDARKALPDSLRILLQELPRNEWASHDHFNGLVSFWLDRHLMFRRLLTTLQSESQLAVDKAMEVDVFASRLHRYAGIFVEQLQVHHHMEDMKFFPKLSEFDSRLTSGFDILDADHHALDENLAQFVLKTNKVLQSDNPENAIETTKVLVDEITRLEKLLDRHLTDEEELVVPILLKYGTHQFDL